MTTSSSTGAAEMRSEGVDQIEAALLPEASANEENRRPLTPPVRSRPERLEVDAWIERPHARLWAGALGCVARPVGPREDRCRLRQRAPLAPEAGLKHEA